MEIIIFTKLFLFVLSACIATNEIKNPIYAAKIKLYASSLATLAKKTPVMVTLETYPIQPILLEVYATGYLILYLEVGENADAMPLEFTKTDNISEEIIRHNIVMEKKVTYINGYYLVVNATFFRRKKNITLTAYGHFEKKRYSTSKCKISFDMPEECVPRLYVRRGFHPFQPLVLQVGRDVILRVVFSETCEIKNAKLNWTITDLMERELKVFAYQTTRLSLMPYTLNMPITYELWRNRFVVLITGEHNGFVFGARGYLQTKKEKVVAVIRGGLARQLKTSYVLHLDGSQSRDNSKPSSVTQFRNYNWSCESKLFNDACRSISSTAPKLKFPSRTFFFGDKVKFTLTVVADDNPNQNDSTSQNVTFVNFDCLEVEIICQTNCAQNAFNPRNKVVLKAECYNCNNKFIPMYTWFINGNLVETTQILAMQIKEPNDRVKIELRMTSGAYLRGSDTRIFRRHKTPADGKCNIKPTQGMEVYSFFRVCCENFTSEHPPLRYYYYADGVLLTECEDCKCASHLPLHVSIITVLICDELVTCDTRYVNVKVTPLANITMDTPQSLWKYITTPPNNIVDQAARGRTSQMIAYVQALATRIRHEPAKAMVLLRAYDHAYPTSLSALGKLANLTSTFAQNLSPIDPDDETVLIHSLTKLNEVFEAVYKSNRSGNLVEEPYENVTAACKTVYNIMERVTKSLTLPPQAVYDKYKKAQLNRTLEQSVIDELLDDINQYSDEGIKGRTLAWLNCTWETERLYRFLKFAMAHDIQEDKTDRNQTVESVETRCFKIEPERTYTIDTRDRMHTVYFSPELIQETRDPDNITICLKVISNMRELNWWYPENMQPSTVLLTVHIYAGEDNFKEERHLKHSVLKTKTVIGKYKPARVESNITVPQKRYLPLSGLWRNNRVDQNYEDDDSLADTGKFINCLERGTLETMHDLRVYRINLDEKSMLVVRFQHTTHQLKALLVMNKLPSKIGRAVRKSGCIVPANSRNTSLLMRNNCLKWYRVYLILQVDGGATDGNITVPGGPANFSFVFQVRSCDYWVYSLGGDKQRWSHKACQPGLEFPRKDSIECTCTVLGTYTSYVFHVPATNVPTYEQVPVSINWWYLMIFILVFIILLIWLVVLFMFYNKPHSKTILCDMTGLEDESEREAHDLLVYLKTGGRINALTTATVKIIFETQQRRELIFTLMQDPENPELTRNSTYVLWLRTRDIRIPTRMAISHNMGGRYPSWFLRRIELVDVQDQLTQVFVVHRWVRDKYLILSSDFVFHVGDYKTVHRWRKRFSTELERQWINWGLWHPLTGMWREGSFNDNMTRAHRASIFLTKLVVVYCVCACYLGPTTPETVFKDRKKIVGYGDLIKMFMISFVLTNLVHFLLENCVLRRKKLIEIN